MRALWSKTLVLRSAPRDNAAQTGELKPDRPYYVMGASNDWTHLTVRQGGEGWVRLTELSQHEEFKELIGVVWYAQAMLQHLNGKYPAATSTWKAYLKEYAPRQDAMNQALARIFLGYAYHLDLSANPAQRSTLALKEFSQAAALLPNSASPVNCQAMALFG